MIFTNFHNNIRYTLKIYSEFKLDISHIIRYQIEVGYIIYLNAISSREFRCNFKIC